MITKILAALFLLGISVFFHELGHFLMAKLVGVRAKVFSIGYGRGLFYKRFKRTIYQITAIPLGGYVQFYGDDITREYKKHRKGDFFSVGPLQRILIAFGGPMFSFLLGIFVIFFLIVSGWQPLTNKIQIHDKKSPAYISGLKDGDRILSVNGYATESFEKINYYIAMASESKLNLEVERGGAILDFTVFGEVSDPGTPQFIGVQPAGKQYLVVQESVIFDKTVLREGDKIVSVNKIPIYTIDELRSILNQHQDQSVTVEVNRSTNSLFSPSAEEKMNLVLPVKTREVLVVDKAYDIQTGRSIPRFEVGSWDSARLGNIFLNNESFSTWKEFKSAFETNIKNNKMVKIRVGSVNIDCQLSIESRGMMGVSLVEQVEPERANLSRSPVAILTNTVDYSIFMMKSTVVGLVRIIEGQLSFRKSVSGPVKIVAIAAKSVEVGWDTYFFLMANITIVLGIMNLLPIPVFDGGHIFFYLIEFFYKPLPLRVITTAIRFSLVFLVTLGIYVIGLDIWDVFLGKIFGG